jgi:hypothetical protein
MAFLALVGIEQGGTRFEIVSRPRLDTRQIMPFYRQSGVLFVGVLERARVGRELAGAPLLGWEAVGIDFGGVDETGDILSYGQAVFSAHAGVTVDETALAIPLPSHARSIGFLTELGLPLLLPVKPPAATSFPIAWGGETHVIRFLPAAEALRVVLAGERPAAESLLLLLWALVPPPSLPRTPAPNVSTRFPLRSADELQARLRAPSDDVGSLVRTPLAEADLRFLRLHRVPRGEAIWELVIPASGLSLAVLPYVETAAGIVYFLYEEPRLAAVERAASAPLFDLPTSASFVNAAGVFLGAEHAALAVLGRHEAGAALADAVATSVERAFPGATVAAIDFVSPPLDTCPGTTSERRLTVVVRLASAPTLPLPRAAFAISEAELVSAVSRGLVHDPVVALALLATGADPFSAIRAPARSPIDRRRFLDRMTEGSVVQRRLRAYSTIEREQLGSATYARLMLVLQHRFGVRIAYPETAADRSFFKAAFRVFMAADREEHRELQGLHWSHDAYHFALGNYTLPDSFDFEAFYLGDERAPPPPTADEAGAYVRALKAAEDEATFFSFYTLFAEQLSLTRHVGKLTFWEALRDLGLDEPQTARRLFDQLTVDGVVPTELSAHPLSSTRPELGELFAYMKGFRDYHHKDIEIALGYAKKDAYRGLYLRYGLYEHDVERYVARVRAFPSLLAAERPGLHPLLAALSDQKVGHALLVWDVGKALRALRAKTEEHPERRTLRTSFIAAFEPFLARLDEEALAEAKLRERLHGAELTAENEARLDEIEALGGRLRTLHDALWDTVAAFGLLDDQTVTRERARQLPR